MIWGCIPKKRTGEIKTITSNVNTELYIQIYDNFLNLSTENIIMRDFFRDGSHEDGQIFSSWKVYQKEMFNKLSQCESEFMAETKIWEKKGQWQSSKL